MVALGSWKGEHIKGLEEKSKRQAREIEHLQESSRRRTVQLTAMGYVWCAGGCGPPLEAEAVELAVRNTERMVEKLRNQRYRERMQKVRASLDASNKERL